MKQVFLFLSLIVSVNLFSQTTIMRIHEKGGTVKEYSISSIDSITYETTAANQTIAGIVSSNPDFSLLKQAVLKAGLAGALSEGTLTVFAPDNAAFAASNISESTINAFSVNELTNILTYHVIGAKVSSNQVPASDTVNPLSGVNLYASNNANGVFINGIKVKAADIPASNGIIHVISKVLIPPTKTVAQLAAADPELSTATEALNYAGLTQTLSGPGKFTVFVPTNQALEPISSILFTFPKPTVASILKSHVIGTNVFASDLINGREAFSLETGKTIVIGTTPPSVKLKGSNNPASKIILPSGVDIIGTNGVIHKIDRVMQ
jgi:uncharacterized surface protein with fasciclin (FAS1) repeats